MSVLLASIKLRLVSALTVQRIVQHVLILQDNVRLVAMPVLALLLMALVFVLPLRQHLHQVNVLQ